MENSPAALAKDDNLPPPSYDQIAPFIEKQSGTSRTHASHIPHNPDSYHYHGQGQNYPVHQPLVAQYPLSHQVCVQPSAPPQENLVNPQDIVYQSRRVHDANIPVVSVGNREPESEKASWAKLCGPFCFIFWVINLAGVVICVPISLKRELALLGLAGSIFLSIFFGGCAATFCSKKLNRFLGRICCSKDQSNSESPT